MDLLRKWNQNDKTLKYSYSLLSIVFNIFEALLNLNVTIEKQILCKGYIDAKALETIVTQTLIMENDTKKYNN